MKNITVMGLGNMGSGIAGNILRAGYPLTMYNRTPEKARRLVEQGARLASTPAEAASGAEVILCVVGDDQASRTIWLGPNGALDAASPGCILLECSTLSLPWVREFAQTIKDRGLVFIDSPLAGSKIAAENGDLTLFMGGEAKVIEDLRPLLNTFSINQIYFGPSGSGAAYKLINNLMAAIQLAALGEGVALAEKYGLDPRLVQNAITNGASSSPIVKGKLPIVMEHAYTDPHFALRWMVKDIRYALKFAEETGLNLPLGNETLAVYTAAMDQGLADLDWSAVTEVARR